MHPLPVPAPWVARLSRKQVSIRLHSSLYGSQNAAVYHLAVAERVETQEWEKDGSGHCVHGQLGRDGSQGR